MCYNFSMVMGIGKRGSLLRVKCIFLTGALLLSSFSLCACDTKKTESSESSETRKAFSVPSTSETSEEEFYDDSIITLPDAPPETEPEPDPDAESKALAIAEQLGLSPDALRGKYDLFLRYDKIVRSNTNLHEYVGFMYGIFPIIADQLKPENEKFFFEKVRTLTLITITTKDFSGGYNPWANTISVNIDNWETYGEDETALTVYHELIHFIDNFIDGDATHLYLADDGKLIDTGVFSEEELWDLEIMDAPYLIEGGSEKYYSEYITHGPDTVAYLKAEQFMVGLEYIFGSEWIDELFFSHDTDYRFVEALRENGFTEEEILKVLRTMTKILDPEVSDPDMYMDLRDVLIRLYIRNIGSDYENDAIFRRIIASMDDELLNKLPSDYRDFISGIERYSIKDKRFLREISAKKGNPDREYIIDTVPSPLLLDGEWKLTSVFFPVWTPEGEKIDYDAAVFDYDFETDTILGCEIYDDWIIDNPYLTYPDDETEGAKEYLSSIKADNSEAHNQEVSGVISQFSELYERAEEIGNKYGVYIWFGDLIPEGVLYDRYTAALDPDLISETLDQIEEVLSLYPEDYFDQLLLRSYDGVFICLYDGCFEYDFPASFIINGKSLAGIYIDTTIEESEPHIGEWNIVNQYFPDFSQIELYLICDIWELTERYIYIRNQFFEESSTDEKHWEALNYDGFKYMYGPDEYFDLYEVKNEYLSYFNDVDPEYFLTASSVVSSKTDRTLLYAYAMMSAMRGKAPSDLSDACRAKLQELGRIIRTVFDDSKWPEKLPWEIDS